MTVPGTVTGCGYLNGKFVSVIEDCFSGNNLSLDVVMDYGSQNSIVLSARIRFFFDLINFLPRFFH